MFFVFWLLFSRIFFGAVTLSQSMHLGNLRIQYYGLILALASLSGYVLAMHRRKQYGIETAEADNLIFVLLIAGFIGARLYHVVTEYNFYIHNPSHIFAVWNGGLGIYGVVIGGVIALWLYKKFSRSDIATRLSIWEILDWLIPSVVLGQVIGRFGNFVNYELYGLPTSLPWKMFVPVQFRIYPYALNEFFHPVFLYESACCMIILFLILRLKLKPGGLFLVWLLMYNVMRFFLEPLRLGGTTYGSIHLNTVLSLVLIGISIALYIKYVKPNTQNS